jgi:recombinational DNA repair protein (RecF pathway)
MSETQTEFCVKCGDDIDPTRRVDFTLKDGTRVCEPCFVRETPCPPQDLPKCPHPSAHASCGPYSGQAEIARWQH